MSVNDLLIKRLNYLEKIDALGESYSNKLKIPIPNVSGWHIEEKYQEYMLASFNYDDYGVFDPLEYVYSYDLANSIRNNVVAKLGGNPEIHRPLIVANNTIALVNVVNFIRRYGYKYIGVLLPCYFSVPNLLYDTRFEVTYFSLLRKDGQYLLPTSELGKKKCDVLIVTNPIFSTGTYLSDNDIDYLASYLKEGKCIIADESLAAPGRELARKLGQYSNFISIYSPHKFLHFNSFKFSCIMLHSDFEDFFDQWNDVFSGSLNITNLRAINHFLSENYDQLVTKFLDYTSKIRNKVSDLVSTFDGFDLDKDSIGDYLCIYNSHLPYQWGKQLSFIRRLIEETHSLIYPGCLHGFQKIHGFTFRVNLVSYNERIGCSLVKILSFLSHSFD